MVQLYHYHPPRNKLLTPSRNTVPAALVSPQRFRAYTEDTVASRVIVALKPCSIGLSGFSIISFPKRKEIYHSTRKRYGLALKDSMRLCAKDALLFPLNEKLKPLRAFVRSGIA